jgi:hypothetical protein
MAIIWMILKIAIYTFVVHVVFRQTYNFVFILWQKPRLWILIIAILSIANMLLAFSLSWNPSLVSAAILIAILLNLPLHKPKHITEEKYKSLVDDTYTDLGIKHGRLVYRIGIGTFAIASLVSYIVLFSET